DERGGSDRRAAAVGLEARVFDDAVLVDLDLQLHHVAAGRGADHAGADRVVAFIERADVSWIFIMIENFIAVCHDVSSVGSPLDSTKIDAFLVHFPQRREVAQLLDLALEVVHRVVDFFLRREAAQREADGTVGQLVRAPEGAQHVRRFERRRGAGGARGNGDVLHRHDERLALDEIEAQVEVVRHTPLEVAVDEYFFHLLHAGEQPVPQGPDALVLGRHLEFRQPEGFAHARDLVRGQGSRTKAPLVAAAVDLRFQPHARLPAYEQRADAFRAVGLVRRERHQVHLERLQVDVALTGGLRRVYVEQRAALAAHFADRGNVL